MQQYNFTLLSGGGLAQGINDQNQIVGFLLKEDGTRPGVWWLPNANAAGYQNMVNPATMNPPLTVPELTAINNIGLVIPGSELICINWGDANFSTTLSPTVLNGATALNNSGQIVSGGNICFWSPSAKGLAPIPLPLSDSTGYGINDLGDVVGDFAADPEGFIFADGNYNGTGLGSMKDINVNRLVVGYVTNKSVNSPVWIQYSPDAQGAATILPMNEIKYIEYLGEVAKGQATAVNNAGTIVGFANDPQSGEQFAFLADQPGSPAADLNEIVGYTQGWHLRDAMDINESGLIVGTCTYTNKETGAEDVAGYVATPVKWNLNPYLGGTLAGLLATLANGISGMAGMAPAPKGLGQAWESLTVEQRETLLSFAISTLAGHLSDREAQSQIQRIAAAAASRALDQSNRL